MGDGREENLGSRVGRPWIVRFSEWSDGKSVPCVSGELICSALAGVPNLVRVVPALHFSDAVKESGGFDPGQWIWRGLHFEDDGWRGRNHGADSEREDDSMPG